MNAPTVIAVITLVLGAALFLLTVISKAVFKRSLAASLIAAALRLINPRVSDERLVKRLEKYGKINSAPYRLPRYLCRGVSISYELFEGVELFSLVPKKGAYSKTVLYFHGGGYLRMPRRSHIRFLSRLAVRAGVRIILPIYPKAPNAFSAETVAKAFSLYGKISKEAGSPVLMGDSSGGGLSVLVALELVKRGFELPEKLVLLSPWVDLSMDNPELWRYERLDPLIWRSNALIGARAWAKDTPLKSPEVSPTYAELSGLPPTVVFAGERELLYPDIALFYKKLVRARVKCRFVSRRGMNHVYQIYPIPEARRALSELTGIINNRKDCFQK